MQLLVYSITPTKVPDTVGIPQNLLNQSIEWGNMEYMYKIFILRFLH